MLSKSSMLHTRICSQEEARNASKTSILRSLSRENKNRQINSNHRSINIFRQYFKTIWTLKKNASSRVPKLPAWNVMSLQMITSSLPCGHSGVLRRASHATIPTSFMPGSRVIGRITAPISSICWAVHRVRGCPVEGSQSTSSWHTNKSSAIWLAVGRERLERRDGELCAGR